MLSEGSEMLLEILNPGIIGGLVLPVLGALPDSLIILFSGLGGSREEAQEQVAVGMGALAGSTIMLLTIAWGGSLLLGRTDLNSRGKMIDKRLTRKGDWFNTGISVDGATKTNAIIMVVTAALYATIQVPTFMGHGDDTKAALTGAVLCALTLIAYCIYQVVSPELQKRKMEAARVKRARRQAAAIALHQLAAPLGGLVDDTGALQVSTVDKLFAQLDTDGDGTINLLELKPLIVGLSLSTPASAENEVDYWMKEFDRDRSGVISREEFRTEMGKWLEAHKGVGRHSEDGSSAGGAPEDSLMEGGGSAGEEGEEEESHHDLTPGQIARRATLLLAAGAFVCAVFSDPMVEAVSNFSTASGIPAFFVAFVVTPFASNSSELVSSLKFAAAKKTKNLSLTFSQVYGAVTMNNTMCLGLFLLVVWLQGLTWTYTSEVAITVGSTLLIGALGMSSTTFRSWTAPVVLLLYPVSIYLVYVFDYVLHWDG